MGFFNDVMGNTNNNSGQEYGNKCIDCEYAYAMGDMKYKCTKKGTRFDYATSDPKACSSFRSSNDGYHSCYECYHYTETFFGSYKCDLNGKKVIGGDRACSRFLDY